MSLFSFSDELNRELDKVEDRLVSGPRRTIGNLKRDVNLAYETAKRGNWRKAIEIIKKSADDLEKGLKTVEDNDIIIKTGHWMVSLLRYAARQIQTSPHPSKDILQGMQLITWGLRFILGLGQ